MPFSQAITPTALDVRWGHDVHCRVDIAQNATRLPEGNPVFLYRHGGNGESGDKRSPWVAGSPLNLFANWILAQSSVPFDFWSVATPQSGWNTPTVAAHLPSTWNDPRTRLVLWPESVDYMQAFVQWAKAHAVGGEIVPELGTTLGCHPSDMIGVGNEFGALLQALAQFQTARQPRTSVGVLGPAHRFGPVSSDSKLKALVLLNLPVDLRNLGGVDQLYFDAIAGVFGTRTVAELGVVPAHRRASASPLAYVLSGQVRGHVPQYVVNERVGNHLKPYGSPSTGAGYSAADSDQWTTYTQALTAAALAWAGELVDVGDLSDETEGAALSSRIFDWACDVLGR